MYAIRTLEGETTGKNGHSESILTQTFESSMDEFASQITRILIQAAVTSGSLDRLEERLLAIHALCMRESFAMAVALDDLLWQLWTILGGNRSQLRDLRHRMSVLRSVQQYRAVATVYVAATMETLTSAGTDLSELRERLASSSFAVKHTPLAVQIAGIQHSVYRLKEERLKQQSSAATVRIIDGV